MDKKNLPENKEVQDQIEWLPPRLVEAVQGWYIVFYQVNPATGELERERKSYNLGRVGEKDRRKRGKELCAQITKLLPNGYPWVAGGKVYELAKFQLLYEKQAEEERLDKTAKERSVIDALLQVTRMKTKGMMPETVRTYQSRSKLLAEWLTKTNLANLPLTKFTRQHAQAYLDDARERVGNNTYNNYRRECITFFGVMVDREWIPTNPFNKTERLRKTKKKRRPFQMDEATVMLDYLHENDYWLLVLVLLHLGGCLRRTESYRLRFRDFDLHKGLITIDEERSKNHKAAPITIPEQVRLVLLDKRFTENPSGWLLFGEHSKPHPERNCGEQTWKNKHRKYLQLLKKEGKLTDIEGLSLYSWKDTGMSAMAKFLTPFQLKDQARHADTATSMIYYQGEKVILELRTAELPMLMGVAKRQKQSLLDEAQ